MEAGLNYLNGGQASKVQISAIRYQAMLYKGLIAVHKAYTPML
jgi:hypothetical protein